MYKSYFRSFEEREQERKARKKLDKERAQRDKKERLAGRWQGPRMSWEPNPVPTEK